MMKLSTKTLIVAALLLGASTAFAQTITYKATNQFQRNAPISSLKPKHSDTSIVPYYVKSMSYTGVTPQTTVSVTFSPSGDTYIGQDLSGTNYTIVKANTSGVATNLAQTINILGLAYNNNDACIYTATNRTKLAKVTSNGTVTALSVIYGTNTDYTFGQLADIKFNSNYTNAYLLDKSKNAVYKLDMATLTMELVAGTEGTAGDADGVGAAAKFRGATAITLANNTDLYIADRDNFVIKKINVDESSADYRKVETVAGASGTSNNTNTDGDGIAARFVYPSGIAHQNGKLYITDYNAHCIREIDINNSYKVTTIAGEPGVNGNIDGLGSNAKIRYAFMNDINPADGNMYYASRNYGKIVRLTIGKYVVSPSLPTGLTLNETTGEISGTPTALSASTNYTVKLVNSIGTTVAQQAIDIEIIETLPVTLTYFEAKKQTNGSIGLTWATSSETDNNKFILSKSTNGTNFNTLVERVSLGAQGGSYSFTDVNPASGANYYKLVQIDNDGTTKELGVKAVDGGLSNHTWVIYPNPSNGKNININYAGGKAVTKEVKIYNANGQLVASKKVTLNGQTNVTLGQTLASGFYTIAVQDLGTQKIIVE